MTYDYREAGVLAGRYYYDARNLGAHDGAAVDEAATRILTPVALTPTLTLTLTPTPTPTPTPTLTPDPSPNPSPAQSLARWHGCACSTDPTARPRARTSCAQT